METKQKILTVPNALSAYRILAIPFVIWSFIDLNRELFIVLICVNLVTDILDGLIARTFNLCTELGARLDSLADIGTFTLSICGFWIFEKPFVVEHKAAFALIFGVYAIAQAASLLKFRRPTSLHLYTSKILGYIQGIFIFTFFVFGYWDVYFYFMVVASCVADTEVLLAVLALKNPISNGKSLIHILRNRRDGNL